MRGLRRVLLLAAIACMAAAAAPTAAFAQAHPSRHITLVMASPPGGGSDAAARLVSEPIAATLGQPIVMESVTGAGGMIGAAPDGYALPVHQVALASGASLFSKRSFDPRTWRRSA